MKCSIPEKNTQKISVCYIKISIFRKLISLVHFVYSSSVARIYDFIHQNIQQTHLQIKSLTILIYCQLQEK